MNPFDGFDFSDKENTLKTYSRYIANDCFMKAFFFIQEAVLFDHRSYVNVLACMYLYGIGTKVDTTRGIKLLEDEVCKDNIAAIGYLAGEYIKGESIPQNHRRAKKLLEKCASLGDDHSVYKLGKLHESERNYVYAIKSYTKAAKLGCEKAKQRLQNIIKIMTY